MTLTDAEKVIEILSWSDSDIVCVQHNSSLSRKLGPITRAFMRGALGRNIKAALSSDEYGTLTVTKTFRSKDDVWFFPGDQV